MGKNYESECVKRNIEHPVVFDKTFNLDKYKSIHIFKREGEEWHCSECDMSPGGSQGTIPLSEALAKTGLSMKDLEHST